MIHIDYTRPPLYTMHVSHEHEIEKHFKVTMSVGLKSGIYCLKNILNGKVYVGSGQDLNARKIKHTNDLLNGKSHNAHMQAAFNKQGKKGFVFGIIEYCDLLLLEEREVFWITELRANKSEHGYNKRLHCSSNRGFKQGDNFRKLCSEWMKKRVVSEATRQKCKEINKGRKMSEEAKDKLRRHNLTPERLKTMSELSKGRISNKRIIPPEQVIEIKTSTERVCEIAKRLNISRVIVGNIRNGRSYAN